MTADQQLDRALRASCRAPAVPPHHGAWACRRVADLSRARMTTETPFASGCAAVTRLHGSERAKQLAVLFVRGTGSFPAP